MADNPQYESGNGFINGKPMSYDVRPDGSMDIFQGGIPGSKPHEHIVVNQDGVNVDYYRDANGQVIVNNK